MSDKLLIHENVVDRVIRFFDPIKAHERRRARAFLALSEAYVGASSSRRSLSGWRTQTKDADSAIIPDLPVLRERSRDLIRNTPIATGAVIPQIDIILKSG